MEHVSSIICLGPSGAGKTLLLKKLQNKEVVDETSCTIPTTGSNLTTLKYHNKVTGTFKEYVVRELGGSMAPIWHKYYKGVNKVMYMVDASNLCQIAAAGILLFTVLAHPELLNTKVLIVLTKMDVSYRQMRNEALLMLQMKRLEKEVPQSVTILESSAVSGEGVENIAKWIQGKLPKKTKRNSLRHCKNKIESKICKRSNPKESARFETIKKRKKNIVLKILEIIN